jgi:hypothetical protein
MTLRSAGAGRAGRTDGNPPEAISRGVLINPPPAGGAAAPETPANGTATALRYRSDTFGNRFMADERAVERASCSEVRR